MCFSCFETAWAGKNIRCPVKDDRDLEVFEVCGGAVIRWVDGLCGVCGSGRGRRGGRGERFSGIYLVAPSGATFFVFLGLDEREVTMERKSVERELKQRIQTGKIRREDVTRRLAELAFGKANDCVRLALEDEPRLDKLDLSLLSEVKRNDKGTVEIKLIDRLQALEQLATVADGEQTDMDDFLKALQGGGEE